MPLSLGLHRLLAVAVTAAGPSTLFPPGWNGLASTPPMGWRSWNAWGNRVSQANFQASIDALVAPLWTIDGKANQSLASAGYLSAGIDEGWEACGKGVNGTQHDAQGNPVINTDKFPNMSALVAYGHAKGLKIGWYENGCACGERHALDINYQGDVRSLHALGFDGVKLDGCGAQRNMTLYAALMNATGKAYLIENCHWGRCDDSDDSSCPTREWCPFNWYRTSGDINNSPMSWLSNLQTTIQFQDPSTPLSRPGCWAYPDMLEVGRVMVNGQMDLAWNRAHFGAWCIVSSPLILGLDVTQYATVAAVVDVVTNPEAIQVNQDWAGHPGTLVWSGLGGALGFPAARACNPSDPGLHQQGWGLTPLPTAGTSALRAPGGGCLTVRGAGYPGGAGGLVVAPCNASDPSQTFVYNDTTLQLQQPSSRHCVDVHSGGPIVWMYGCTSGPNDQLQLNPANGTVSVSSGNHRLCFGVEADDPAGSTFASSLQAWAKPLEADRGVAVLLINPDTQPHTFSVPLSVLPLTGGGTNLTTASVVAVRDVWQRVDLPHLGSKTINVSVGGMDSAFLRLSAPSGQVSGH